MRFGTGHRFGAARGGGGGGGGAPASVIPAFSPVFWLRADSGVDASTYTDQAGVCTVSQSNASLRPAFSPTSFNGKPGLTFNGSSQYLRIAGLTYAQDCTMVCAIQPVSSTSRHTIFSQGSVSGNKARALQFAFDTVGTNPQIRNINDATSTVAAAGSSRAVSVGSPNVVSFVVNTTGSVASYWVDGAADADNPDTYVPGTTTGISIAALGVRAYTNYASLNDYAPVIIAEVAVFNSLLSNTNRAAVEDEMTTRWGL